jgi:hypothetical protein
MVELFQLVLVKQEAAAVVLEALGEAVIQARVTVVLV